MQELIDDHGVSTVLEALLESYAGVSNGFLSQVCEAVSGRKSVLDEDDVVAERTFEPAYVEWQPNGPDCAPTCRQWFETREVQP